MTRNLRKKPLKEANIKVLPGRYLSREAHGLNPGENHVLLALVADLKQCEEFIQRLKKIL